MTSVIVPIYNQERHLRKCLKSILSQSYSDLEVILVNDGSTDHSLQIAQDYASKDNRISIINKKNEGVAFARRDGHSIAKGKYIMFVDSDDYLPKNAVSYLHEIIERENVDIVIGQTKRKIGFFLKNYSPCPSNMINTKIALPGLWDNYYISYFGINILPVSMWGKIYRKSTIDKALKETDLFSKEIGNIGEDEFFNLKLHPFLNNIYITDETVYIYRFGGITCKYNPRLNELLTFSDIRLELLDHYNYSKGYGPLFTEYRNYLFSEISQRIEYLHQEEKDITTFLYSEFQNRKTFIRMALYYEKRECSNNTRLILSKDYHGIYTLIKDRLNKHKNRRFLKRLITEII